METRIEIINKGSCKEAFEEAVIWLPTDANDLKHASIEVSPFVEPNQYKIVVKYIRKEQK